MKKKILLVLLLILACSTCMYGCGNKNVEVKDTVENNETDEENSDDENSADEDDGDVADDAKDKSTDKSSTELSGKELAKKQLDDLKAKANKDVEDCICMVSFLGYVDDNSSVKDMIKELDIPKDYSFINYVDDKHFIKTGKKNCQLYYIAPMDTKASVAVNRIDSKTLEPTEVLYKSEKGTPILILCNEESNGIDVAVNIVNNKGETGVFYPCINTDKKPLKVLMPNGGTFYDFTGKIEDVEWIHNTKVTHKVDDILGRWYRISSEIEGDRQCTAAYGIVEYVDITKENGTYFVELIGPAMNGNMKSTYGKKRVSVKDSPLYYTLDEEWSMESDLFKWKSEEASDYIDVDFRLGFIENDMINFMIDSTYYYDGSEHIAVQSGEFISERDLPDCYGLSPEILDGEWVAVNAQALSISYDGSYRTAAFYDEEGEFVSNFSVYEYTYEEPGEEIGTAKYNPYWAQKFEGPDYMFNEHYVTCPDKDTLIWCDLFYPERYCEGEPKYSYTIYNRKVE